MFKTVFAPNFSAFFPSNSTLIAGISGGPDSTALLHLLVEYSKGNPLRIIVAHVNHGIRGKEADRDEAFVKKLALVYGLTFEVKRVKLRGKTHLEEQGRVMRRAFFERLREKYSARFICTAHTRDDQLETIIFNFIRGSGPAGLAGMQTVNGFYCKPLLTVSKKEILAYLKSKKFSFCRDRTNEDTIFSRNFIRKKILPLFERINPSFRNTVIRNGFIFKKIDELHQREAKSFLKKYETGRNHIPLKAYEKLPESVRSSVIQELYKKGQKTLYNLPLKKVFEVMRLLDRRIGNKKIYCGGGGMFFLNKGEIVYEPSN